VATNGVVQPQQNTYSTFLDNITYLVD